jgi:hypothetical protein
MQPLAAVKQCIATVGGAPAMTLPLRHSSVGVQGFGGRELQFVPKISEGLLDFAAFGDQHTHFLH